MTMLHNYFNSPEDNNEVDAMRAAFQVLDENNLFMAAQRLLIAATEAQLALKERFPKAWKRFDANVDPDMEEP